MNENGQISAVQLPRFAWLFDVDGVLTDPEAKRVVLPEIFDELIRRLQRNEPIGLNTGRSTDFMVNEILKPLEERIGNNRELLKKIFAIGEYGGAWIYYDQNGIRRLNIDEQIKVPQAVQDEVRQLVSQPPYSDLMFYDTTKRTMVSVELNQGKTIDEFKVPQLQLNVDLSNILSKYNLTENYKIDPTRIATDVESVTVGKALGAKKFTALLKENNINPEEYICFGDSSSDYAMYSELRSLEKKAQLVFVGGRELLMDKDLEGVTFTAEHVDKGTLKYLQKE
jgi:hydroxymethylpyrimidine pyrophosphatase-like HAD family hydrolase